MAIEELYAARLPEFYEMLAYHYERGEVWEKALEYLVKAGQRRSRPTPTRKLCDHYNRALDMCERLGETVEPTTLTDDLRRQRGGAFPAERVPCPPSKLISALREVARQLGDRHKEAEALYQTRVELTIGARRSRRPRACSHQAQAIAAGDWQSRTSWQASLWVSRQRPYA